MTVRELIAALEIAPDQDVPVRVGVYHDGHLAVMADPFSVSHNVGAVSIKAAAE